MHFTEWRISCFFSSSPLVDKERDTDIVSPTLLPSGEREKEDDMEEECISSNKIIYKEAAK